jgi:hypothetical protein
VFGDCGETAGELGDKLIVLLLGQLFPMPPPTLRGVEGTAFLLTGNYLDRSMLPENEQDIITTWPSPELER